MKCASHVEVDAVGVCVKCGKGLCAECTRELGGKFYCHICADVYSQLKPEAISTDQTALPSKVKALQRPPTSAAKESKKRTIGNILIVLGTIGIIASLISFLLIPDGPDAEVLSFLLIFPALAISALFLVIGIGVRFAKPAAALIYGILGLLLLGGLWSILAIIFGAMSLVELKKNPYLGGRNKAIAGLVLGILGIVASILGYKFSILEYAVQILRS